MGQTPPYPQIPVSGSNGVQENPKSEAKLNPPGADYDVLRLGLGDTGSTP